MNTVTESALSALTSHRRASEGAFPETGKDMQSEYAMSHYWPADWAADHACLRSTAFNMDWRSGLDVFSGDGRGSAGETETEGIHFEIGGKAQKENELGYSFLSYSRDIFR